MKSLLTFVASLALLSACTCGGDSRPGRDGGTTGRTDGSTEGRPDADPDRADLATVRGIVWAPGNAPGMVPAGHEIPIFDALVRITPTRQPLIPDMVYCDRCVDVSGPHARTSHDGAFQIGGIVPGNYWLTVEKGQFRLEREISIGPNETLEVPANLSTLPSVHNPAMGQTVPSIAVAAGNYDQLEDVLGKMSIGGVDSSGGFSLGAGSDRIHFYANGGENYSTEMGSLSDLVRDLSRMLRYHIIFIPCASGSNTSALQDPLVLNNIRQYVSMGGKLYVTDWSGEWMDNVFPAFIELEAGEDTPGSAYDASSGTWNTSLFGGADGDSYDSHNAEVVDDNLFMWLDRQSGPYAEGGEGMFNASQFDVVDSWNTIMNLNRVEVGVDDEGLPVLDDPIAYVIGGHGNETPKRPLTVTFEPTGCGRVLFSTYHTTETAHTGLVPQERILLYLIMQIGVCFEGPILI